MKSISIKFLSVCAFIASSVTAAFALDLPAPMSPPRLVNDFTGIFTTQQRQALESKLVNFDRETSTQIAVVTVADLDGTAISDYAQQLFDKWGIGGSSKNDNGALILIKPKTGYERGEVFIATGYGLEGAVPDALAGRIVDYDMLPSFSEGDYYTGVDNAVNTIISLTRGEYTADDYLARHEQTVSLILNLLFIALFIAVILLAMFGGKSKSHTISAAGDIARGIIIGSMLSGGRRGGGGGFSGGGGFGGFGGGRSGGGGAGGSW